MILLNSVVVSCWSTSTPRGVDLLWTRCYDNQGQPGKPTPRTPLIGYIPTNERTLKFSPRGVRRTERRHVNLRHER